MQRMTFVMTDKVREMLCALDAKGIRYDLDGVDSSSDTLYMIIIDSPCEFRNLREWFVKQGISFDASADGQADVDGFVWRYRRGKKIFESEALLYDMPATTIEHVADKMTVDGTIAPAFTKDEIDVVLTALRSVSPGEAYYEDLAQKVKSNLMAVQALKQMIKEEGGPEPLS